MSVTTRADNTAQTIPAGPSSSYVKLKIEGATEWPTEAGRTLVVVWVSSDAWPHKATAESLKKTLVDATRGTSAWAAAVEASLVWLLDPPLVKFRAVRHAPGEPDNFTERDVRAIPLVGDAGFVYMAEFDVLADGWVVSVEVAKDPAKAVTWNYREIKIVTIVPRVAYL